MDLRSTAAAPSRAALRDGFELASGDFNKVAPLLDRLLAASDEAELHSTVAVLLSFFQQSLREEGFLTAVKTAPQSPESEQLRSWCVERQRRSRRFRQPSPRTGCRRRTLSSSAASRRCSASSLT